MNTRTPTSTVVFFSLISNDIFREGVVCWQKIFLCLHISKFNKIIGPLILDKKLNFEQYLLNTHWHYTLQIHSITPAQGWRLSPLF